MQTGQPNPQAELATIAAAEALLAALARGRPALVEGVLGYMRIRAEGRAPRELLVGSGSWVGAGCVLIDWRTSPLSEVFFAYDDGDAYEVDAGDQELEGVLLRRRLLRVEGTSVVEISARGGGLVRSEGGQWSPTRGGAGAPLRPRDTAARLRLASPIEVVLDEGQRAAVMAPAQASVLVTGPAGFGKTTVALHRVARLLADAHGHGRAFCALTLVPTEGLKTLLVELLSRLGAEAALVSTVDEHLSTQGRIVFAGLPDRDSSDASPAVIWLKRNPIIAEPLAQRAVRATGPLGEPLKTAHRQDLLHLFGDSAILEALVPASDGYLSERRRHEVLDHTHVQFSPTTEHLYADVDPERRATSDGRLIDDGTPMQDAETLDVEDFPLLFELHVLRSGGVPPTGLAQFDHILIDEAQEVAPFELSAIAQMLRPDGTIAVVGDSHQQIDETAFFEGWEGTLRRLGLSDVQRYPLSVSYRCPPGVMAMAEALTGEPAGPGAAPAGGHLGLEVALHPTPGHLAAALLDSLRALRDPQASVALICRSPEGARALFAALRASLPMRLALGGNFLVGGGINVTCVEEVKGLEFDYVVVPDLDAEIWPDTLRSRRALYVAITRATWHCLLLGRGTPSPLLALSAGASALDG